MEGLSARLAEHVATFPDAAVPASARHAARRSLLDGLGVMLAASGTSEDVAPFVALAGEAGGGPAAVLGTGRRAPPALAALANGAMAHALDFEDAFDAVPSHPNASLLPAALAIAQADGAVDGGALLAAIAIGCDVACRLGLGLRRPMEEGGWYPPPILGAFGAAAAAARLRRLDARGVLDTWSLMLCQASCPGEIKYDPATVLRAVREALPAQAAVQASALAAAGVRGFDAPFEGPGGFYRLFAEGRFAADAVLDRLGEQWWIEQLSFKRWPACRGTHAYVEAAQVLRARHRIAPDQVVAAEAIGGTVQRMLAEPLAAKQAPATPIDAKFSIPFTVAAALIDEEVTLDSFAPERLGDPHRRALAARVGFSVRDGWGRERAASGVLRLWLADGGVVEHEVATALGDVARPLDDAALGAKFLACAARARQPLSPDRATGILHAVRSLDATADTAARLLTLL